MQNLTPCESRVLDILAEHVHDDDESWEAWPSHRTLVRISRYSAGAVKAALRVLEAKRLIRREPRRRDNGSQLSNLYAVLPTEGGVSE